MTRLERDECRVTFNKNLPKLSRKMIEAFINSLNFNPVLEGHLIRINADASVTTF